MDYDKMKIMVPKGWEIKVEEMPDGNKMLTFEQETIAVNQWEDSFKLVPASQLRFSDNFLNYIPKTTKEISLMKEIKQVIKNGANDFWRPTMDPSLDDDGHICYQPGMKPAVGKSANWWSVEAKNFCPERKSRLGTKSEYVAFLACFIKELVESGRSIDWAWKTVCDYSKELGHYWDSTNAKHEYEITGSRTVCGWSDLANTVKLLEEFTEVSVFWSASGYYGEFSDSSPLSNLFDGCSLHATGWIVFPKE